MARRGTNCHEHLDDASRKGDRCGPQEALVASETLFNIHIALPERLISGINQSYLIVDGCDR
jgi:hypothetical protein